MVAETVVFIVFAVAAVAGALTMVWAANAVYSAMGLMVTMFSLAVFYVLHFAHFVAMIQIIVYAGAVLTLFLFVVMFIGVDTSEERSERLGVQRPVAIGLAALFAAGLILAGSGAWFTGPEGVIPAEQAPGAIEVISDELFSEWVLPFEVTGLLFIVAAAGTIALAQFRRPGDEGEEPAGDASGTVRTGETLP